MAFSVFASWFSIALIDTWGRRMFLFFNHVVLALFFTLSGVLFYCEVVSYRTTLLVTAWLAIFIINGPDVITFLLPIEIFKSPYSYVNLYLGSMCGNIGALVSQIIFFEIDDPYHRWKWLSVMILLAVLT